MTFWQPDQIQRLRSIPLESVLPLCGAQLDRHDRCRWHTLQGVLSVTGVKFMNWTQGIGGGGAIDLVIHLHRLDFNRALVWLHQHFPGGVLPLAGAPCAPVPQLKLPPSDPAQLGRVQRYLIAQRALPAALVQALIRSGKLYADPRANAVFLLLPLSFTTADPTPINTAVGAELRGTSSRPWRGLAPGSRKDLGLFSLPVSPLAQAEPPLHQCILCESAIDAISCFALHPQHCCLSTAGARPNPAWLTPLLNQGHPIYCGFDADPTGDDMARAMIALHPQIQRLRPSAHDWNDVLRARARRSSVLRCSA